MIEMFVCVCECRLVVIVHVADSGQINESLPLSWFMGYSLYIYKHLFILFYPIFVQLTAHLENIGIPGLHVRNVWWALISQTMEQHHALTAPQTSLQQAVVQQTRQTVSVCLVPWCFTKSTILYSVFLLSLKTSYMWNLVMKCTAKYISRY